jgi:uncharacterized protein (UPF0276 family)
MASHAVTLIPRDGLGVGLRPALMMGEGALRPPVDYFEIISENFMGPALLPRRNLQRAREHGPIVMHGVSLNLLGHEPLNMRYLDDLAVLAERIEAPFVSDHLCWTGAHGLSHHDLLPTPYTEDLIAYAAERAALVQRHLGRPFALENVSSYVQFAASTLSEWEFYRAVVDEAGVSFMLDINNIYVSSQNHEFDARVYLRHIPFDRVVQVHLAGHDRMADGAIIDTHDRRVADEVWALYREAWKMGGPFPTLLEWDDKIPEWPVLLQELEKAREVRA